MVRRKGEKPVVVMLDSYHDRHPVALMIASGSGWFGAWAGQKATPYSKLTRMTGINAGRLVAIDGGDRISRAELDALALAWGVSAGDIIKSMPDSDLVVE
jgi:hypothetical protein